MDILVWMNTRRVSDDPQSQRRDVPECPHTCPIWERPNASSHWSYNAGSETKIRKFHFPQCDIFHERNEGVNVIRLDSN